MQQRWSSKIDEALQVADDPRSVMLHSQVRDRVANMSPKARSEFLLKHGGDLLVASALLSVPGWLSNVSDAEIGLVRSRLEKSVLSDEVREAKNDTGKAMLAAARGWRAALNLVSDRAKIAAPTKIGTAAA